jgi:CDP-diacylglycerol--serine O-phosphatidyltransferase
MIANFPYYSFKGIDLRRRVPFVVMIAVVLVFGLITLDPPSVLLVAFLVYALSGPVMQVVKRRKGRLS